MSSQEISLNALGAVLIRFALLGVSVDVEDVTEDIGVDFRARVAVVELLAWRLTEKIGARQDPVEPGCLERLDEARAEPDSDDAPEQGARKSRAVDIEVAPRDLPSSTIAVIRPSAARNSA
jgi:hypothetical protein